MSGMNGMSGEVDIPLLQGMCQAGKGNFYYMKDPDTCVRAFAYELAGLLTTVGQEITITVEPTKHLEIQEVCDDVDVEEKDGKAVISLTDLMAEEKKYLMLKVCVVNQQLEKPLFCKSHRHCSRNRLFCQFGSFLPGGAPGLGQQLLIFNTQFPGELKHIIRTFNGAGQSRQIGEDAVHDLYFIFGIVQRTLILDSCFKYKL